MSDQLYGKKFFLKMCTKCGKQFMNEKEFNIHSKICGSASFKSPQRAETKDEIGNKTEEKSDLNLEDKKEPTGFEELDKVTVNSVIDKKDVNEITPVDLQDIIDSSKDTGTDTEIKLSEIPVGDDVQENVSEHAQDVNAPENALNNEDKDVEESSPISKPAKRGRPSKKK
jgi:hypothetical protein